MSKSRDVGGDELRDVTRRITRSMPGREVRLMAAGYVRTGGKQESMVTVCRWCRPFCRPGFPAGFLQTMVRLALLGADHAAAVVLPLEGSVKPGRDLSRAVREFSARRGQASRWRHVGFSSSCGAGWTLNSCLYATRNPQQDEGLRTHVWTWLRVLEHEACMRGVALGFFFDSGLRYGGSCSLPSFSTELARTNCPALSASSATVASR